MTSVDLIPVKCGHCDACNDLKRCARCKCAKYCSRQCQLADAKNHTVDCKSGGRLEMELGSKPEGYFFYRVHALRVRALIAIAAKNATVDAWRCVLKNQCELLHLDKFDIQFTSYSIPFTLLHLGCDDKVVSVAKKFLRPEVALSKISEVPVVEDMRFEDIISDLELHIDDIPFAFLVSLLIVKLRTFEEVKARKLEFAALLESSSAMVLQGQDNIIPKTRNHIFGEETLLVDHIACQNVHADQLILEIGRRDLQAFLNNESHPSIPEFVARIVADRHCFFHSTPGVFMRVQDWIETHVD